MVVSLKRKQRSKPKYYVYYNDWTGEILSVGTSERKDSPAPFVETYEEVIKDIIDGSDSVDKYLVYEDSEGEISLVKKSKYLRLRHQQENKLVSIPEKPKDDWDIRIKLFTENLMMIFEVNEQTISKLVAHNINSNIRLEKETYFDFYLVRKNEPDYLLETISVNVSQLINNRIMGIQLEKMNLHSEDINNISILTRRQFQNYYFEKRKDRFLIDKNAKKTKKEWVLAEAGDAAHISIEQDKTTVTIKSLVTAENLSAIGLNQKTMMFYLIGDSPDEFIDSVEIQVDLLRMGRIMKFDIEYDLDDLSIMYENKNLKVRKKGLTNEVAN